MQESKSDFENKILRDLSRPVIGCAIEVHRNLGPGLLESSYQKALEYELGLAGIDFQAQVALPMHYKGVLLDCKYRIDLLVDNCLVVELKSVEEVFPLYAAQILTYMKLAEAPLGLLLNFNVKYLKQGIRRFIL